MIEAIWSVIKGMLDWFYSDDFVKAYDRSSIAYRNLGFQITADLDL